MLIKLVFFFIFRFTFDNNEKCLDWFGRLLKASSPPRQLEELFAFFHFVWSKEQGGDEVLAKIEQQKSHAYEEAMFRKEVIINTNSLKSAFLKLLCFFALPFLSRL